MLNQANRIVDKDPEVAKGNVRHHCSMLLDISYLTMSPVMSPDNSVRHLDRISPIIFPSMLVHRRSIGDDWTMDLSVRLMEEAEVAWADLVDRLQDKNDRRASMKDRMDLDEMWTEMEMVDSEEEEIILNRNVMDKEKEWAWTSIRV